MTWSAFQIVWTSSVSGSVVRIFAPIFPLEYDGTYDIDRVANREYVTLVLLDRLGRGRDIGKGARPLLTNQKSVTG
jgi:hypothetical protein